MASTKTDNRKLRYAVMSNCYHVQSGYKTIGRAENLELAIGTAKYILNKFSDCGVRIHDKEKNITYHTIEEAEKALAIIE